MKLIGAILLLLAILTSCCPYSGCGYSYSVNDNDLLSNVVYMTAESDNLYYLRENNKVIIDSNTYWSYLAKYPKSTVKEFETFMKDINRNILF